MRDPLGSFLTIKENFIRYVQTAFGTKFEGIEKERYDLLNYDKVLYRIPWIEPLPDYKSSGKTVDDLSLEDLGGALTEKEANTFKELVKTGLFPGSAKLHAHQAKMLKAALEGNNCVVTSGTGSGKTESFLLPLFAQLAKELSSWQSPMPKSRSLDSWWREKSAGGLTPASIVDNTSFNLNAAVQQRSHVQRPAAVRALILYPMNALVEDQMSRLRKALDSDDTRTWLSSSTNSNAIYFGRYNGSTPVAGELSKKDATGKRIRNNSKINKLQRELRIIEGDAEKVNRYIAEEGVDIKEAKDLKSFFPRLDGAEMRCRFDMQIAPPDILITNYSMLSIMLMREVDAEIFNKTRDWLACTEVSDEEKKDDEKKNRVFHLIIDELHLYRGTQGTEVAYLLRLVLNRLGLHPDHPQLKILASSASLEPGDENSRKFLRDFFGTTDAIKPFTIIEGEQNEIKTLLSEDGKISATLFEVIARCYDEAKSNIMDSRFISACDSAAAELAAKFNIDSTGSGIAKLLHVFTDPLLKIKERLFAPCRVEDRNGKVSYKAVCTLFNKGDDETGHFFSEVFFDFDDRKELKDALRGLLIVRALIDEVDFKFISEQVDSLNSLPRFRFHYFFRNIEGMWASTSNTDGVKSIYADNQRTAGKLYPTSKISTENGKRVLELLYCDNCGTTLFGGSRLITRNSQFELLPISPNIEGIPEKTPAKLVEKRSYQEYAVFWPCGRQSLAQHDITQGGASLFWRQTTVNGFDQTNYEASWVAASLNNISGDIFFGHDKTEDQPEQFIKGYLFCISSNGKSSDIALQTVTDGTVLQETHRAMPNVCPACGVNHQKRNNGFKKGKTSSIRGFRTGFAKTTQMFAKELMYELPNEVDKRKLIVFSDSREDAAQIANGIERNHFSDLLREILVDELYKNLSTKSKILNAIETDNQSECDSLKELYPDEYDQVNDLAEDSQMNASSAGRIQQKNNAIKELAKVRQRVFSVRELVDTTNSMNLAPLIRKFIDLGINPGGNDLAIQTKLLNNQFVPWYELIDFSKFEWTNGADQAFINELKEGNYSGLSSVFFGSLFYSFESSGLGYLTINPNLETVSNHARSIAIGREEFLQALNGVIRILGDKFKHNKSDYDITPITAYSRFPAIVKSYIRAVASRFAIGETQLGEATYDTLIEARLFTPNHGLIIEELFIKISSASDVVWTSKNSKRPHLHFSGGICTFSLTALDLQPDTTCDTLWSSNYLSYTAIKEQRPPIRLHCEELTGQTDDQFERQRHFRNVILSDEGNPKVKQIDLLSVTTTLEVGVDIGALQAVMLGNMPPQRFNYQQRVGRAGRRGQAYSVILTFCRGRSHDEFYFTNPQKITGDAPPVPFLTMKQERIYKRLLAKEVLRQAYLMVAVNANNDEEKSTIHGEFGKLFNWPGYKEEIISWIENNQRAVEVIVDSLITPELSPSRASLIEWSTDTKSESGLMGRAQTILSNEEIATDDISEKLAEGGLLPMFGMPTTVKNLYHGINREMEPLAIDRPQSMAIYEFAPGAQKTKDKAIHTSIGFTNDLFTSVENGRNTIRLREGKEGNPFSLNRWFVRCRSCGFFETYSEEDKAVLETIGSLAVCSECGESNESKYQPPMMLKAPIAYRTDLSMGSDSKEDSEVILSRPPIFAEKKDDLCTPPNQFNNTLISISDKDVTWRVNTNADKFFSGRLANTTQRFPFSSPIRLSEQWIMNDSLSQNYGGNFVGIASQNGFSIDIFPSGPLQQIALASNKSTEVLRITPVNVHPTLDLNMFAGTDDSTYKKAHSAGVRSGYYSAAFLLQRVIADKLDIDPAEVEVADIAMRKLDDDRKVAEIVLTDELPNGSGFVRYLYSHFQNILGEILGSPLNDSYLGKIYSPDHQSKCEDSCYDCLKGFRNMNYHSLLDWRLGFSLLRCMNDITYACGADGNFEQHIELQRWKQFATMLRDNLSKSFNLQHTGEVDGLPIIRFGERKRDVIMIVHPFWDMKDNGDENWLSAIKAEIQSETEKQGGKIKYVDSFNLHRRPGWCYEKLIRP